MAPLNHCHVIKSRLLTNRLHSLIHGAALLFLFHYRVTTLLHIIHSRSRSVTPLLPHLLILIAEAVLAFIWLLNVPSKWRPVVRTAHPENLPPDDHLPSVDVFICTADPSKEPTLKVMNTVVSALALDYPPEKLHVYISDDGGSHVTLNAAKQAWVFAKFWVPFCKKYRVKTICPEAYFRELERVDDDEEEGNCRTDFLRDEKQIQERYEEFKSGVSQILGSTTAYASRNHWAVIEVIGNNKDEQEMPFLAYVAREKRPSQAHNFKAGALNVLLRVSAMITNSPYILVLDCDMYCNDPSSARHAMCFHLDPDLAPNLSFVQFPQKFYNVNLQADIYDCQIRFVWGKWEGLDGLNGPILSGTGFYIKRDTLYGAQKGKVDCVKPNLPNGTKLLEDSLQKELQHLASCTYDNGTNWGNEMGFRYFSVAEDYFTGLNLHCEGWTSVFVNPPRPFFLGTSPVSLGDKLIQYTRWYSGMNQVMLSKYSPILYGPLRMSLWQSMCYADIAYASLYFVPLYVLTIVPPICFLRGIPLYPKVTSPYFTVFVFAFLSSQFKHVQEVLSTGHTMRMWAIEQRFWMILSLGPYLYATVDVVLEKVGLRAASFLPTNKVDDDEQENRYRLGLYDFQASPMFMVPLCTLYLLNMASFFLGFGRILKGSEMIVQGFMLFFGMVLHFPLFEGMVLRKDKGRVAPSVCLTSAVICVTVLYFGSVYY